jgi:hypothetical protein
MNVQSYAVAASWADLVALNDGLAHKAIKNKGLVDANSAILATCEGL